MEDINVVTFAGRVGKLQEVKSLPGGKSVFNFAVANSSKWKTESGDTKEKTVWLDCAIFGNYGAAIAKHMAKGQYVTVVGKLSTSESEKDGQKRTWYSLNVDNIHLGEKAKGKDQTEPGPAPDKGFGDWEGDGGAATESEIPF